jgi:group I intron endonuclease
LELCDIDELNDREQFWIDKTQCFKQDLGYNICLFANTTKGLKLSNNTKIKISNSLKGKNNPMFGKTHSEETKNKISKFRSKSIIQLDLNGSFIKLWESAKKAGQTLGVYSNNINSCCRKIKYSAGGYIWIYENEFDQFDIVSHLNNNKQKIKVIQLSIDNIFIKEWNSITEATKETKSNNIYACCVGKQKSSGGFKWMYVDEYYTKREVV